MQFLDFFDDLVELSRFIFIYFVNKILPQHWLVRGDDHDFQLINLMEFLGFSNRRTGHTGQLLIHAEIILEGNRRVGPCLLLNPYLFLGFYRLMQTFRIPTSVHLTPGELIDDNNFIAIDQIFLVFGI